MNGKRYTLKGQSPGNRPSRGSQAPGSILLQEEQNQPDWARDPEPRAEPKGQVQRGVRLVLPCDAGAGLRPVPSARPGWWALPRLLGGHSWGFASLQSPRFADSMTPGLSGTLA